MDTSETLTCRMRIFWLGICWAVFLLVYMPCGWYAGSLPDVPSIAFGFERNIPFLAWMIVPYMSSAIFFVLVFFLCRTRSELRLLAYRILFVTIVAGVCYMIYPLKFSFALPEISGVWRVFFKFLGQLDTPFNQAPSLHICYAFIFWSVVSRNVSKPWNLLLKIWLVLMCFSTLAVYQHHIIDIIASILLIVITFCIFAHQKK